MKVERPISTISLSKAERFSVSTFVPRTCDFAPPTSSRVFVAASFSVQITAPLKHATSPLPRIWEYEGRPLASSTYNHSPILPVLSSHVIGDIGM